jgi:glycosyltransferase involved in cell wall biosynthesis
MKNKNDFAPEPLLLTKENMPFASVIVIVLNMDTTISGCLRALEKLDYPKDRYEIIVVDGGSTDKTLDIVKKFDVRLLKENKARAVIEWLIE